MAAAYAIGIDLGTTNCALAYAALDDDLAKVQAFAVPQLVEPGEWGERPLLPSFAYLPGEHELPPGAASLPWDADAKTIVGEAARRQGARVPGRLVASAKSWLCHPGVDRRANILPWSADPDVPRLSPVAASALYLSHLRHAWNRRFAADDPALALEKQKIALTVPASFDEVARELTVAAAEEAGLKKITLLEEPQAAFYDWMRTAAGRVPPLGTVCAVIDCGGGTTDFSLIAVGEDAGAPSFERLAVGEHLLLGGDNMDLALARHVEQQVSPGRRLDSAQWGNLASACRLAKEVALGSGSPDKLSVSIRGRGTRVVGASLSCDLERSTIRRLALDGFLPFVEAHEEPARAARGGLQEFGLPFVADPAITRHLAAFLRQHAAAIRTASAAGGVETDRPTAVLFNGGVFNASACQDRVMAAMKIWYGPEWQPLTLNTGSLDLAVARGAAYAAWAKATGAQRIKAGVARSYYVGVGGADVAGRTTTLCLVPHGLGEGESLRLAEPELELQIGEPVSFPLYTSTVRTKDKAGQVLKLRSGQLQELPALNTILKGGKRAGSKVVPVRLEATLTEIGTLELYLAAKEGNNRWRLHLQARPMADAPEPAAETAAAAVAETWSQDDLEEAAEAIYDAYPAKGKSADPEAALKLPKVLEAALGLERAAWPPAALRGLWEHLKERATRRDLTLEHECRWLNLAGFFLRPGWGDPLDPHRVELVWKTLAAGPTHARDKRAWAETWILWRRISGGLDANRQHELAKKLLPILMPGGKKSALPPVPQDMAECWRAAASLERLPAETKTQLGREALRQLSRPGAPGFLMWALTRLGSRTPLYGPANEVVPHHEVEAWLESLLDPAFPGAGDGAFALAQLCRMSGDRARDVDDELRERVVWRLEEINAPAEWRYAVQEWVPMDSAAAGKLLGDAVPPGLRLA